MTFPSPPLARASRSRLPFAAGALLMGFLLGTAPATATPARARVRPERARPGELFAVELPAGGGQATARFLGEALPLYADRQGGRVGYAAVPVDAPPGPAAVELTLERDGKVEQLQLPFTVVARAFRQRTLTVAQRFTKPSAAQLLRTKADREAFDRAYATDFGPPLFDSEFASPRAAEITGRFGDARVFNGKVQSTHLGLDLDGRVGDPIYAANDGVVRMTRDCFYSGRTVVLSHGAGLFTGYFHLERWAVREGQQVRKGDLVGHLGLTGRVTGPHLHFSTRLNHLTFDPEALLEYRFFPGREEQSARR